MTPPKKDELIRIITKDGSLRAMAAVTTALVEEVRLRQRTDPTATVALGRLLTGTALLGSTLKDAQRLAVMIEGSGPLQKLHAETDASGHVRGTVKNPLSGLPLKEGRFDVPGAIGRAGFLHVIRDLGLREPYRGMVQLHTSEVAEDLAYYFATSEQVPSSVSLGVYLEPDGRVSAAGGFMIQVMPPGEEGQISELEERLADFPPPTTLLREGKDPLQILERLFSGIPFSLISRTGIEFQCTCSREQIQKVLRGLGREELLEMANKEEATTVTCEYCREIYTFDQKELAGIAG